MILVKKVLGFTIALVGIAVLISFIFDVAMLLNVNFCIFAVYPHPSFVNKLRLCK